MSDFQNYFSDGRQNFQGVDCDTGCNDQADSVKARFLQAVFQPETFRQQQERFRDFDSDFRFQNESRYTPQRASEIQEYRLSHRGQNVSSYSPYGRSDCSRGNCYPDINQGRGDINLNYIQSLVRQGAVPAHVLTDYIRETQRNPNSYHALQAQSRWDSGSRWNTNQRWNPDPRWNPNQNWDYTRGRSGYRSNDWGYRNQRSDQPDYQGRFYPGDRNYYQNDRNYDFGDVVKDALISSLLGGRSNSWHHNQYQNRQYRDWDNGRYDPYSRRGGYYDQGRGQDIGRTIARIAIPALLNQIGRNSPMGRGRRAFW